MHLLDSDSSDMERIRVKGPNTSGVHDGLPGKLNVAVTDQLGTIQTANGSKKRSKESGSKTEKFKSLAPRIDRHH